MIFHTRKGLHPSSTDTLIGEGTVIEGRITSEASLRIEGRVLGDIECSGDVLIGEKGEVHSILTARNVMNAGTVIGTVHTTGKLTISAKGRVIGEVDVGLLHIVEGGVLQGTSTMSQERVQAASGAAEAGLKPVKGNKPPKAAAQSKADQPQSDKQQKSTAAS